MNIDSLIQEILFTKINTQSHFISQYCTTNFNRKTMKISIERQKRSAQSQHQINYTEKAHSPATPTEIRGVGSNPLVFEGTIALYEPAECRVSAPSQWGHTFAFLKRPNDLLGPPQRWSLRPWGHGVEDDRNPQVDYRLVGFMRGLRVCGNALCLLLRFRWTSTNFYVFFYIKLWFVP